MKCKQLLPFVFTRQSSSVTIEKTMSTTDDRQTFKIFKLTGLLMLHPPYRSDDFSIAERNENQGQL